MIERFTGDAMRGLVLFWPIVALLAIAIVALLIVGAMLP